jgi:subtilisin family serine protease
LTRRENFGRFSSFGRTLVFGLVLTLALGISTGRADAARPVTVLIAAKDGRTSSVIAGVKALGGTVTEKTSSIGYVKAELPAGRFGKVSDLAAVKAVDVDRLIRLEDPKPQGQSDPQSQMPPDSLTPRTNPYMPVGDTGADTFTADPDHDGRGTTIAVLDTGVDVSHPALQTTTDSDPKVIDWFNANPPGQDGTWVATEGRLNGQFSRLGKSWIAPATGGPFAFGTLVEDRLDLAGGELGGNLDRDGITGETIGVIQNRFTLKVLVDTDQDQDFTDETPMTDFKVDQDIGTLGVDNPATPIAEDLSFTVQTNQSEYDTSMDAGSWVDIGIAGGSHGTHVAGIASANEMFGGAMGGAAPGANLISIQVCRASGGCLNSAMMDGMIYAAKNGADVANMSVGGLPALNDGNDATAALYNRLIDEFGMQIFISAGNDGSGANSVGEPGNTAKAVSVGASITKETWLSNYGAVTELDQMLMPFSSRGPSESGAMKPDLVAPGSAVSTIQPWLAGSPVAGTFDLPPGYAMYNGTSMSAPQATGDAALLVGAYKDKFGQAPEPAALRNAMASTADFVAGVPAHGQGTGLIDVAAAWAQLGQVAPVQPPKITATVPVKTVLTQYLPVPDVGVGIHEREGVKSGDTLTRDYTLTRTSGTAGSENFNIGWKGNDGTFDTAATVSLPLNTPVQLPVEIEPTTPGIHSAILQLDDPATNGIDLNTQNVVFATDPAVNLTVEASGTIGRGDSTSVLIDVPESASALRVDLDGGGTDLADGQVRFLRYSPAGEQLDPLATRECYNPPTDQGCSTGSATARVVEDPEPGVWEIAVEGAYRSSVQDSPWSLKASLLDASVTPASDVIRRKDRDPFSRSYQATNEGAPFTGFLAGGHLASTYGERSSISMADEAVDFPVVVPEGAESVSATVGDAADPAADLDLYLLRCEGDDCEQLDAGETAGSEETVRVDDPEPGEYTVEVVPYDIPAGTTAYDYSDSFVSPDLGEITTDDTAALRGTGDEWTVGATISPGSVAPAEGRKITGELSLLDDSGSRVGGSAITLDVDTAVPEVTLTSKPPATGFDRTPTFEFDSNDPDATYECRTDDGSYSACSSPHTTTELSDGLAGDHTFAVRASDDVGNVGEAASADFTIVARTKLTVDDAKVAWRGVSTRVSTSARLVKSRNDEAIAGQAVSFKIGGKPVCSATTDASGSAACAGTLGSFNPGAVSYSARFAGERRLTATRGFGGVEERTGNAPDRKAPKFIGKIRLKPKSPKAGQRIRFKFRSSEKARLAVRVGGRIVRKNVTLKTRSVLLPRLKRGRKKAVLVLVDAAKNRSKARKIRFRVR